MRGRTAGRGVAAGVVALGGVVAQVAVAAPQAGAYSCNNGSPDCVPWDTNGCWDAYRADPGGTFISEVYTPHLGYVDSYFCFGPRSLAGNAWSDNLPPVLNGTTLVTRTWKNGAMVSDTHGLDLSWLNTYKWTKQLNDKNICGYTMGWSGSAWYPTTCY